MAKGKRRDRLLRHLPFWRSTPQPPDSREPTSQIPSSVASSSSTNTPIGSPSASNPSMTEPQPLWIQAFNQLSPAERKKLDPVVLNPDRHDTASVVDSIRTQLKQAMGSNRDRAWKIKWRGEDIVLRDIVMKTLQWVDKFKPIVDKIVQYDPVHTALPWAAFSFLLQVCLTRQNTGDAVLIGLEKTSNLIDRCLVYESVYLKEDTDASRILKKAILKLYIAILKFYAKAIEVSNDNVLQSILAVEELSQSLGNVETQENALERDANAAGAQCTAVGLNDIQTFLEELRTTSTRLQENLGNINHMLKVNDRTKILEWTSTIPYTSHHQRISRQRLEGTGKWLLARNEYRDWRASSASKMLLLRGIPGAGKTYMASKIIDILEKEHSKGNMTDKMAYFYCNRAEENRRDPDSILNTLIQQLVQVDNERVLKPIVDFYKDREQKGQTSSGLILPDNQEMLIKITDIYSQTTICLDALDEIDPDKRINLLKSLKLVIEKSKNLVKIFATSRNDPDILHQFKMFPRIDVQPDDNEKDIREFIQSKVERAIDDAQLLQGIVSDDLRIEICDALGTRSKGMFQLAAVQITFLCQLDTDGDVRTNLNNLPNTLKQAYEKLYNRIISQSGSSRQLALNAFRWVKFSYEPLASNTLLDAVRAHVSDSGDYSQDGPVTTNTILKVCQNLLIWDEPLDTFRFAHLSVEEYLETKFTEADCHAYITKTCLSLLCSPKDCERYDQTVTTEEGEYKNRHILLYSATFWPWHFFRYEALRGVDDDSLVGLWEGFTSQSNYRRWLRNYCSEIKTILWTSELFWQKLSAFAEQKSDNPLFSTCIFGLRRRFEVLFELQPNINHLDMNMLLSYACRFGYLLLVQYLLVNGGDVSAANKDGRTPLLLASSNGHEAVARLLLDKGADVSAADKYGKTPLLEALSNGHEAVARLLLDKGADVSAADEYGRTPLLEASSNGHEAVARLLLDKGADASAADEYGRTPLLEASSNGHEAVARLLLDKGADVSAADEYGRTPLLEASSNGHEAVAWLLLDKGADVSAADKYGRTPLLQPSSNGHEAVARLLLDKGADVSAADKCGRTPLLEASSNGHEAVARLLLDKGADVSAADKYGRTPLLQASSNGHEAVARLLLDKGADVSAADKYGRTPLLQASSNGHEAVARLLLDKGPDVSAADKDGGLHCSWLYRTDTRLWHGCSIAFPNPPTLACHDRYIENDFTSRSFLFVSRDLPQFVIS
ncbi:hypothetical protein BDD12DRAFT_897231 [Trichophaea hybrida]|nr:hypothetical protein BDD12DRAFT_897231 [Trichophaea hybrida]